MSQAGEGESGESPAEQTLWPVFDDDDLPPEPEEPSGGQETHQLPVPPAATPAKDPSLTGVIELPPGPLPKTFPAPTPPAELTQQLPVPPPPAESLFTPHIPVSSPPPEPRFTQQSPAPPPPPEPQFAQVLPVPAPEPQLTRQVPAPPPPQPELTRQMLVPAPPEPQLTQHLPLSPLEPQQLPAPPPPESLFTHQPAEPQAWPPPEPPRAAPRRIGPPPPLEPPPPPDKPKRRRARVALIVVAVLVVIAGAGTGAVFLVPGLSDRLGITKAKPTVAIEPPAGPVLFAPSLRPPGQAPAPTPAGVKSAIAQALTNPGLGTLTGVVLDPATNQVLWSQGPGTPQAPASSGKLLTAAAALLSLNHAEQFSTTVVAGKTPGSVVIVGGGDPTLSSLKAGVESVYPGAAHLSDLVNQVKAKGPVQTVSIDLSRFTGNPMASSWDNADIAGGNITPIVPAMLDGGRTDATKAESARVANPGTTLAQEFANRIGAKVGDGAAAPGGQVLGEVRSAPVVELVDTLLQESDNVLAEAMAREVARVAGEEPSFAGGSRATLKVLQQNGFDTTGVTFVDGSGLSAEDRVPAGLLASILAVAAGPDGKDPRTAKLRPLLGGLPVAGGSGTLQPRYGTPASSAGRGWVRAKTGTLGTPPVNALAGIVLDTDGRLLVFAFLTSGTSSSVARPALDVVAATLRKCGCGQ